MYRYRPRKVLEKAMYGDVTLCDNDANEPVVVKEINLRKAVARQRLYPNADNPQRERATALRLIGMEPHANVLGAIDEFEEAGSWFLVMEYCEGGDLCTRFSASPDTAIMTESEARGAIKQILQGVHFLHDNGIAHRDISLENVLCDSQGNLKICDFGLSTSIHSQCSDQVGKPYCMAPEIVSKNVYNPQAADIWSIGVILFIMLTGSPPVKLATVNAPAMRIMRTEGVSGIMQLWGSDVSASVQDLLSRLLSENPLLRPTTNEALAHPWFLQD